MTSVYMDMAATTPVPPRVAEVVLRYMVDDFGNAGSRTHDYGTVAKKAVQTARQRVADAVSADATEVIFTSGATESNNIALLGLAAYGERAGRRHIISCVTEHKAVLDPLDHLAGRGFDVELVRPGSSGRVRADDVLARMRDDTLLVSLMQVNNETGVMHPIAELARRLRQTPTFFHVDAAQGFGKFSADLRGPIDLISISGHKIGAPKGIGALVARRRDMRKIPLTPLMYGGGQERKLRPGTLPVALIMGLAEAVSYLDETADAWHSDTSATRADLLDALRSVGAVINGDPEHSAPHILNVSFPGADAEAVLLALKHVAAISTGSACTSASYSPSHVLAGMDLDETRVDGAVRFSWWGKPAMDLSAIHQALRPLIKV